MTRRQFRQLIILSWGLGLVAVVVTLTTNKYLPPELWNYLQARQNAALTTGEWLVFGLGVVLLVSSIIIYWGLYRFKLWAKNFLWPIHIAILFLMPGYGPSVMTGWALAANYLTGLLTGGILFLVYVSPVSQMFEIDHETR